MSRDENSPEIEDALVSLLDQIARKHALDFEDLAGVIKETAPEKVCTALTYEGAAFVYYCETAGPGERRGALKRMVELARTPEQLAEVINLLEPVPHPDMKPTVLKLLDHYREL